MGDPRKLTPKAETPRKMWDSERITHDSGLRREYGLKNTRELQSTTQELKKVRRTARMLLAIGEEGKEQGMKIVNKLQRLGISKGDMRLEDVLGLSVRDFLERRLQTLVLKKGLARTPWQARQIIVHGFISVSGRRVTIPSYVVTAAEEPTISYYRAIDVSLPETPEKNVSKATRANYAKEAAITDATVPNAPAPGDEAKPDASVAS